MAIKSAPFLLLLSLVVGMLPAPIRTLSVNGVDSYIYHIIVTGGEENGCNKDGNTTHCQCFNDIRNLTIRNSTAILLKVRLTHLITSISFCGLMHIAILGTAEPNTIVECKSQSYAGEKGAGLHFLSVRDVTVASIMFKGCGVLHDSTTLNTTTWNTTVSARRALYLDGCIDATFVSVHIVQSNGNGLTLYDTTGTVNISDCTFVLNKVAQWEEGLYPGGGGMYVEFTYCSPGHSYCNQSTKDNNNSRYLITNCRFVDNTAQLLDAEVTSTARAQGTFFQGMGRGGGLGVFFKGEASNNTICVEECHFEGNSAIWGGGFYVVFQDSPLDNTVLVSDSCFYHNAAIGKGASGGGAIDIGLLFFDEDFPQNNSLHFLSCNFTENSALSYGGGVGVFSSQTLEYRGLQNELSFDKCHWTNNTAQFGAAVDVSPDIWNTLGSGFLPSLTFKDCTFQFNSVTDLPGEINETGAKEYFPGRGVFLATAFPIEFEGTTFFIENIGTAIYVTSSCIIFRPNSTVTFRSNAGMDGGAVALIGDSAMLINDDSSFTFINNTSDNPGAAIYFRSVDVRYAFSSRSCFIQYQGNHSKEVSSRNILFEFDGNHHTSMLFGGGNSIFATSINPCFFACSDNSSSTPEPKHILKCIANFLFHNENQTDNNSLSQKEICLSTVGGSFDLKANFTPPLKVIPGKEFPMPFDILDDLRHTVSEKYHISVKNDNGSDINLGNSEVYMSFNRLTLYGHSGNSAKLIIIRRGFRSVALSVSVALLECPPGFVQDSSGGRQQCVCSAAMVAGRKYKGIMGCDTASYQAHLSNGYWMGYLGNATEQELVTGFCPSRLCSHSSLCACDSGEHYVLPSMPSVEELDKKLCGKSRTGRLCGSCSANYSVYFHSYNILCGRNTVLCRAGIVFYILSELLPCTILFLIVMLGNISFTSGAVNGFILFAQVFDSLTIDAQGFLLIKSDTLYHFIRSSRFMYRFLNLEFFATDKLSFCLWEGATALDILAIKYVTVLYALLLVVATVLVMQYCLCCQRFCYRITPGKMRSYVIHGLSAFLVMCYTQVATVSFYILTPISLYGQGHTFRETVIAYQGTTAYFSRDHLPYALPAILFLVTIVALPPLLLLLYPLHYRVLAFLHLSETKCFLRLSRYLPISRLKPLLDSFQSCFKDNFRFFAGLYFFYRISIHGARVFITSMTQFYTIIELELLIILLLHCLYQPYQRRWHNVLDSLLFFDMAVINGLTLYNYSRTITSDSKRTLMTTLISIQVVLAYLPLVYIVFYMGSKVVDALRGFWDRKRLAEPVQEEMVTGGSTSTSDSFEFPYRMLSDEGKYTSDKSLVRTESYSSSATLTQ